MIQVTTREFRSNQATIFAQADAGEQIVIRRRGKQAYMLVPVNDDEFKITPELHERIMAARKQHEDGTALKFSNKAAMMEWLEGL